MIELSKISFSTISYVTEDLNLVLESIKQCLPDVLRDEKFKLQKMQSQFGDKIVLISGEFAKNQANQIIGYLGNNLTMKDKKFLSTNFSDRLDLEGRLFHFRLNKFLPLSEELRIGEGSDVIKVEIKYQVFTSDQNTLENVRSCMLDNGIISE